MCIVQLLAMAALYFRQTYEQNRHASMIGGCIVYSALPSLDSDCMNLVYESASALQSVQDILRCS